MSKSESDPDPWVENYPVAAFRHWRDAQLLERENRVENADQLYGIASECAIKKALIELPAFVKNGTLSLPYKEHINDLWGKVNLQSLQKRYPGPYACLKANNPFLDWHVNQRYVVDGAVSLQSMHGHRESAKKLLGVLGFTGQRK